MALPADLDRIVRNIEHENEQLIKLIEQEKQQIEAIERENEYEKQRGTKLLESNSQLDDEIKRHHKQFIHLRDNCESLKKTATILSEHEEVLVKKLDQVVIENERERIERDTILSKYREMWAGYQATYESFPHVKMLRTEQDELTEIEQTHATLQRQINQLKMQIQERREQKDSTKLPFATLEQFAVKLAELKLGTMGAEKEFHQMHREKKGIEKQIIDVKEQLRSIEEERLMNMAIVEQETSKTEQVRMEMSPDSNNPTEMEQDVATMEEQPEVQLPKQMLENVSRRFPCSQMLQPHHRMSPPKGPTSQQMLRKSPPQILSPEMRTEMIAPPPPNPPVELPLLRQLHTNTLQQKFAPSECSGNQPMAVSQENISSMSVPQPMQAPRLSVPQLAMPRQMKLTMPQPLQPMARPLQPMTPRPLQPMTPRPLQPMTPRPPQPMTPRPMHGPVPVPQLKMPRTPQLIPPQSPQLIIPRPQTPMLMMPRPPSYTPKIVTTPKIQLPQRIRSCLPMEMIGTPGKSNDLPVHVDTPQILPTRPADFPRVSLPMDMIGKDATTQRIPVMPGTTSAPMAQTITSGHATSSSASYDADHGYSPQTETGKTPITPHRPASSDSSVTPTTPGERGISLNPDDSPFNLEKHLRVLSELKSKSPGFTFQSRPMLQRESNESDMDHTPSTFLGQNTAPSTSQATAINTFSFGFNAEPSTAQSTFNFGATETPASDTGFNFGGEDSGNHQQSNFSFGGFGASGDNAPKGNIFSLFGDGGNETVPKSPDAGFSFAGFGGGTESPSFNAGGAGGFNLF